MLSVAEMVVGLDDDLVAWWRIRIRWIQRKNEFLSERKIINEIFVVGEEHSKMSLFKGE